MANETSIATEATRSAAAQNAADYTGGIAAHINGDYGKHNQVKTVNALWPITQSPPDQVHPPHNIPNSVEIRLLVTIGSTDTAIIVPGIPSGTFLGNGTFSGSPNAVAPSFSQQPVGGDFVAGSTASITVGVVGTGPILISWVKNGTFISGQHNTTLFIENFEAANAGLYSCIATNSNGQTTSDSVTLAVRTTTGSTVPVRPDLPV